jgi:hypothetical protein
VTLLGFIESTNRVRVTPETNMRMRKISDGGMLRGEVILLV